MYDFYEFLGRGIVDASAERYAETVKLRRGGGRTAPTLKSTACHMAEAHVRRFKTGW
jgi:hypothetical protein